MSYLIAAAAAIVGMIMYFVTAKSYYMQGYNDALEDIEKLALSIKKEVEKRQKDEE